MEDIEFVIERKILHIGNHLIARRNQDLKSFGLTSSQSEALLFIEQQKSTTLGSLKKRLNVSHQAVQKTVGRLREEGLVHMVVSEEDARMKKLSLSDAGKELCHDLKKAGALSGHSVLNHLTADERKSLLKLLSKIEIE